MRVTLRYIEILDSKDVDTQGEFRFRFRAGVPERDDVVGCVEPGESLLVEAEGEEVETVGVRAG